MSQAVLLQKIEKKREQLNRVAWNKPLFSEEVVRLSKELDQLLNRYDKDYASRDHFSSAL